MATTSSSSSSSSSPSTGSDSYSPTAWTEHTMLSDVMQQKGLLIGLGLLMGAFLLFRPRAAPEEKAARRLVRDWRKVDDADDARDLIGDTLPTVVRPALLIALGELERQVHRGFARLEHDIERL